MTSNTVVLSLDDYNELREFKERVTAGSACVIEYFDIPMQSSRVEKVRVVYVTTDKIIEGLSSDVTRLLKELADKEEELKRIRKSLETATHELFHTRLKQKETIDQIKELSYWQFKKWKKG